jgi:hypothetical protein
MVKPPRGNSRRRGVFATRSPHRPNPIGLTAVPLYSVSGLSLVVGSNDLIDGTPILDIKPYLPEADAFPDSQIGWLSEIEAATAVSKRFDVSIEALAAEQLQWLAKHWHIDFFSRAKEILEQDPTPHRTRRICSRGNNLFRMGCGAWRLYFSLNDRSVLVHRIAPGYPPRLLSGDAAFEVPYQEAQVDFSSLWGNEPD